jgi:thioredoxin 1
MVGKMLTEVDEQNFDGEVLNSDLPVFACFTTSWCSSCFPMCFVADELASRYEGRIKFVRMDQEKAPGLSVAYNITVVPSIILFEGSEMVKKLPGYQEETILKELLDKLSAGGEATMNLSEEYTEKKNERRQSKRD